MSSKFFLFYFIFEFLFILLIRQSHAACDTVRYDTKLTKRNTEVEEHVYSKEFRIQGQGSECGLCYSINGIA